MMDNNIAIEFKHVSKIYTLKSKNKKEAKKQFYALKDINFNPDKVTLKDVSIEFYKTCINQ